MEIESCTNTVFYIKHLSKESTHYSGLRVRWELV